MCGIVGYNGKKQAKQFLIDGLKKLEYRGYDSAGVAVIDNAKISVIRKKGKVDVLAGCVDNISGVCGIGHTRWATHGKPSDENSHPHSAGKFAIVHNGIIENFLDLKIDLVNSGVKFSSQTDTEVIVQLLNAHYDGCALSTLKRVTDMLVGSYALAVLCADEPDKIFIAKNHSPIILGKSDGESFVASDIPALLMHTKRLEVLLDNEFAVLGKGEISVFNHNLIEIEKPFKVMNVDSQSAELGDNESFMMKEIKEIPRAIKNTIDRYLDTDLSKYKELLAKTKNITIVACGTAYHSGIVAKYVFEKLARVPVSCEIASEFRYSNPLIGDNTMVIAISQSGETADTLAAAKMAKTFGASLIAVTNTEHSALSMLADIVFPTIAGLEISVAATKSYNSQLAVLYMMAFTAAEVIRGADVSGYIEEIKKIPDLQRIMKPDMEIAIKLARDYSRMNSIFFLGRNLDYAVSLEGSLKLKEVSYIHSEGYAAGELKHGTIALIDKNSLVIAVITQQETAEKTLNAVHEVMARDASVGIITMFDKYKISGDKVYSYLIPKTDELLTPLLSVTPMQVFACFMARARGCDPDKPRNLAKSVTVE